MTTDDTDDQQDDQRSKYGIAGGEDFVDGLIGDFEDDTDTEEADDE